MPPTDTSQLVCPACAEPVQQGIAACPYCESQLPLSFWAISLTGKVYDPSRPVNQVLYIAGIVLGAPITIIGLVLAIISLTRYGAWKRGEEPGRLGVGLGKAMVALWGTFMVIGLVVAIFFPEAL